MIGLGMAAFAKTNQDVNEKQRPANEERAHEPVAELKDVIDLISVLGRVRGLTEEFVDQREATHIYRDLPESALDAARAASGCDARDEN